MQGVGGDPGPPPDDIARTPNNTELIPNLVEALFEWWDYDEVLHEQAMPMNHNFRNQNKNYENISYES